MAIEEVRIPINTLEEERKALTIEQEFSIEIPDKEADAIHSGTFQWRIDRSSCSMLTFATVTQAVDYICHQPDGTCYSSLINNAYTDPCIAH